MNKISKTSILLASLLILTIPAPVSSVTSTESGELTTTLPHGNWVNDTLVINGSTTIAAQDAKWALYDVTDPYSPWELLRSAEYFSAVIPVDDNLWIWSITIDVQGLNCTCWLEISQPDGLQKALLKRIIFIGEGPHNPVLSLETDSLVVVDEPVLLSARGILADSNFSQTKLFVEWCHAPLGACEGESGSGEVNISWNEDLGEFTLDATALNLSDGIWEFTYYLQDLYLRTSPLVKVDVYVDQTDPEAVLIAPQQALEGDSVIIDGSESRDGVWEGRLQAIWYVTPPDGVLRVAEESETDGMVFTLLPSTSGIYSVQVDVVDMVGRRSSATVEISVENVVPTIELKMGDAELDSPNTWQLVEGEELTMSATVLETGTDNSTIQYNWYLDDELVCTSFDIAVEDLEPGIYELRLIVIDDDGASDTHEMEIIVKSKAPVNDRGLNIMAIALIIAIICAIFLLIRRINLPEKDTVAMPKWHSSSKSETNSNSNLTSDENEIWNESTSSTEGKE
jgi:hypothetical protein